MMTTSKEVLVAKDGEQVVATLIVMEVVQVEEATAQVMAVTKAKEATKVKEVAMELVATAEAQVALASSRVMITLVKEAAMKAISMTGVAVLKKAHHHQASEEVVASLEAINKETSKIKAFLKVALVTSQPLHSSHPQVVPLHQIRFSSRTYTVTTLRMT